MEFPLARDPQGNPLTLPPEAAYWRVRQHTGGRPRTVLGADGEPLFIGLSNDRAELLAYGCSGSIRLEAVDSDYKPVRAPVAYVELAPVDAVAEPARKESVGESLELVRATLDALTRSVEATQRSQIEHERGISHREKAITEAQIEMLRHSREINSLLLDRATGGKPKDSLATLQEYTRIQKAVEELAGKPRNAAVVEVRPDDDGDTKEVDGFTKWAGLLLPLVPAVTQSIASAIADPKSAESVRNAGATIGQLANSFGIGGGGAGMTAAAPVATMQASPAQGSFSIPRVFREVLAVLDDTDSDRLLDHLDSLDVDGLEAASRQAQSIASLEERVAWTRGLLRPVVESPPVVEPPTVARAAEPMGASGIPAGLLPVIAQLTEAERAQAQMLLSVLDRATIVQLGARLLALSPAQAAAAIRDMIAEVDRRAASIAQRAAFAALDRAGAPPSSGEVKS